MDFFKLIDRLDYFWWVVLAIGIVMVVALVALGRFKGSQSPGISKYHERNGVRAPGSHTLLPSAPWRPSP